MGTEPLEGIEEQPSSETPEDVAILYSWANLQGAKYRDFSANRREYRAQMRRRAAEQLRLMELRAQSEAEAAATQAEAEAAAAHAEADAAAVKLAVSRSTPAAAPEEILKEKEVEEGRDASLREAAQQARRAAAERLEAARRGEAASLADSIARREEREIAEAQASALRQAAQYQEAELKHREDQVPGRISDPYSPQILAEGEYYDGPGTPPSELVASRFRTQREYIERSTGTELPQFKMPPLFDQDSLPHRAPLESGQYAPDLAPEDAPRRLTETPITVRPERQEQDLTRGASYRDFDADPATSYLHGRDPLQDAPPKVEVVSRIPDVHSETRLRHDDRGVEVFERGRGWGAASDDPWPPPSNGLRPASLYSQLADNQKADEQRRPLQSERQEHSSTSPRTSGSWLREIAEHGSEDGSDHEPSSFPVTEKPAPRWLYPAPSGASESKPALVGSVADSAANQPAPPEATQKAESSLLAPREKVASRWFSLKKVFPRTAASEPIEPYASSDKASTPMVAVYSLAGGVGKTSLVATLGRVLSSMTEKVLLVDATSRGLLPLYFGANEPVPGVVRTFIPPTGNADAPIRVISYEFDQKSLDGAAQAALVDDLLTSSQQVSRVLLDLNASCGWLIESLARCRPISGSVILVPLAPDMNSIVSLAAVEKTFAAMQTADSEALRPFYLLSQFDASLPLHLDLREVLRQELGDRLLPFVIRRVDGISEALAEGMTIVDYDPSSSATQDFKVIADWIRAVSAPATAGLRGLRWSER